MHTRVCVYIELFFAVIHSVNDVIDDELNRYDFQQ